MTKSDLISGVYKLTFLLAFSIMLLDAILYFGVVQNHLYLNSFTLACTIILSHLCIRIFTKQTLAPSFTSAALYIAAPITTILAFLLFFFEEYGYRFPNYFFTVFGLDYRVLPYAAVTFLLFAAAHTTKPVLQNIKHFIIRHWPILLPHAVLVSFFLLWWLYLTNTPLYLTLTREDNLIEYLSFIGFLAAGLLSGRLVLQSRQLTLSRFDRILITLIFGLASVAFFIVAMEEISWGQRIFDFSTPQEIASQNTQSELNFHNNQAIWPFVYYAYAIIGIYGGFAWIFRWLTQELVSKSSHLNHWLQLLIPPGYLALFFYFNLLYVWLRFNHGPWRFGPWEEVSELYLIIGIVLFLIPLPSHISKMSHDHLGK